MFVKRSTEAPRGFFACEAAGLQWLSAADGGVPCARIIAHDDTSLTLERLDTAAPTRSCASRSIMWMKPLSTSPITFSSGTKTSSKNSSDVPDSV